VTAGFSQSLAWLGWEAPSAPEAVGGGGSEEEVIFLMASSSSLSSGSTEGNDEEDGKAAGRRTALFLASGLDGQKQRGVARDATRRESAAGASGVAGWGSLFRKNFFEF
jgi:hypothetical protein